jgi:uncharacterized phage protein (TIGR02218 family)
MTTGRDVIKELYRFVENNGAFVYTVTSSDQLETYNAGFGSETYMPLAIGRDEVQAKGEMAKQNLTLSFPIDNTVARRWFAASVDFPLTVTIFSKSVADGVEIEWKGRLSSVSPKKNQIDFIFESVFTSMRRIGLRQTYQITCPHALYSKGCNLNKEDWDVSWAVSLVVNNVVTMPGAAGYVDGYFTSGIFEDMNGTLRFITSHVGSQITLIRPINDLITRVATLGYSGLVCRIFPGCDRSAQTCNSKFNNILNHGGFPFMPKKNPFGGTSIV